jgi:hypothetical protein
MTLPAERKTKKAPVVSSSTTVYAQIPVSGAQHASQKGKTNLPQDFFFRSMPLVFKCISSVQHKVYKEEELGERA